MQIKRCTQYASNEDEGKRLGSSKSADEGGPGYFQGKWTGSIGWGIARGPITLDVSVNGNRGSGSSQSSVGGPQRIEGAISGNSMTYQHTDEDDTVTVVPKKVNNNTLSYGATSAQ
ncbi:hypothetical protein [Rhizobium sp. S163]|uniref:hypothetical protein n=1 Tax=Rhizobium sp. S163 TaxID=3055039 RepID=UPI0025AA0137|nr:hypothetical protein [Rhizobium sp. S163]MDM9645604.1 hypothetical protein [Rhizobium sp. S163]